MKHQDTSPEELAPQEPATKRETDGQSAAATDQQAPRKGRRKAALIAVLAVLALVGAGLTAAFTTRSMTADNVLTFGSVKMRTIMQEQQADGSLEEVPEGYEVRAPFGLASRVVTIQNMGVSDMYVRARPVIQAVSEAGEERGDASSVTEFRMDETGAWVEGDDGWWYYTGRVSAADDGSDSGEVTAPLMEGLEFVGDVYDLTGPGGSLEFTVEAQAVQADNNGESALDAQGWPEEGAQY